MIDNLQNRSSLYLYISAQAALQPQNMPDYGTLKTRNTRLTERNNKGKRIFTLLGCLHDTGATFAEERVHSGSLSRLYICLHHTTTNCHAGASHPGVSSPRFLYRVENFTLVRNLAAVSCKRETSTRFGVKSVCR